jgi:tetratricopeptide (TPR) repeat protein
MIGRDRELAELVKGLDEAAGGRGGLWLVTGEPGIGKSRLAEEAAEVAVERGMAVHWGRCWEAGGAPAYWPWIQVLRSALASRGRERLVSERAATLLVQILPELADDGPESGETPRLEPDQALFALMDSIFGVLRAASSVSPTLVLLEDLHAADPASITMLDFLSRQLRTVPLVVVGNYRETEARREGVSEGLATMTRGARTIRLGRLGVDEVTECVREISGTEPGPRVAAAIHEASEGNPLYVVEIAGLMESRGQLDDAVDHIDIAIPDSVKAVIRERAEILEEPIHERLEAAAVIGREFPADDLAELLDEDLESVQSFLVEAVSVRIIDRVGVDCYRFAHILIREVFIASLAIERRRALHVRRADLLEGLAARGREVPWNELAYHLLEAGPDAEERAVDACIRAAEQATAQLAFDDAAELLDRALVAVDRLPEADLHRRCVLLLERARALLKGGNVGAGRRICREASSLARQIGDPELDARAALIYGSVFVIAAIDPDLVEHLREALKAVGEEDSALRARLLARLAAAIQPSDDPEEPMALARDAIEMARRVGDRRALLHSIRSGCSALMDVADPGERIALNREHVALADELGEPFEALRGYMRLVIDAFDLGDLEAADAAIAAYERLAQQTELPHHLWQTASFRAMRAMMVGRFDDAEELIETAQRQAERLEDPTAFRTIIFQRRGLARAMEAVPGSAPESGFRDLEAGSTGFTALFQRLIKTSTLARMDRLEEAPPGLVEGVTEAVVASRDRDRSILCPAAEIVASSGHQDAAEDLANRLQAYAEHWLTWGLFGMVCEGPIARHVALLQSSLGRTEEAKRNFDRALELTTKFGLRPMAARIGYEYARHLEGVDGDSGKIRSLLSEARHTASDLGQVGLLELIDGLGVDGAGEAGGDLGVVPMVASFSLEREGELWICTCGGEEFNLKNTKGVRMLAQLVAEPGREIHVLDLSGTPPTDQAIDGGDAGEVLDATAKAQYQRRVEELRAEIEEAEGFNDPARAARAKEELEIIAGELSKAFGLGGRERRSGSAAERARVNVQRRLRDAVKRIVEQSPAAGKHLEWALKTGMYCSYDPT